ncbi:hypothetical protein [Streptomyces mirabilis]
MRRRRQPHRRQLDIGLDGTDLRKPVVKELGLPRTVATLARAFRGAHH